VVEQAVHQRPAVKRVLARVVPGTACFPRGRLGANVRHVSPIQIYIYLFNNLIYPSLVKGSTMDLLEVLGLEIGSKLLLFTSI
jgi:hypothetical protein